VDTLESMIEKIEHTISMKKKKVAKFFSNVTFFSVGVLISLLWANSKSGGETLVKGLGSISPILVGVGIILTAGLIFLIFLCFKYRKVIWSGLVGALKTTKTTLSVWFAKKVKDLFGKTTGRIKKNPSSKKWIGLSITVLLVFLFRDFFFGGIDIDWWWFIPILTFLFGLFWVVLKAIAKKPVSKAAIWTGVLVAVSILIAVMLSLDFKLELNWLWVAGIVVGIVLLGTFFYSNRKSDKVAGVIKWGVAVGALALVGIIAIPKATQVVVDGKNKLETTLAGMRAPYATKQTRTISTAQTKNIETLTLLPKERKRVDVPKYWNIDWDMKNDLVLIPNGTKRVFDSASDRTPITLGDNVEFVEFENPNGFTITVDVVIWK